MKNIISAAFAILFSASFAFASVDEAATGTSQLTAYCKKTGGQIINRLNCTNSGFTRDGEFCVQKNAQNKFLIFNGCSAPQNSYNAVFFKACIIHDFCYHSEPAVDNKSRTNCDDDFYKNMKKICATQNDSNCLIAARTYYNGVIVGGGIGWLCLKDDAEYPSDMDQLPMLVDQ